MANYEDGNIRPLRLEQDKDKTVRYTAEVIDNIYSSNLAGVGKKSLMDGTIDPFDLYIISKLSDLCERFQIDPAQLDDNLKQLLRAYNTAKPEADYHSYLDDIDPTYESIINSYRNSLIQQGYDPLAASFIVAETPLYPERFTQYLQDLRYNDDNLKNNVLNYFNTSLQQFKTKYLQQDDNQLEESTEPIIINEDNINDNQLTSLFLKPSYSAKDLDDMFGVNFTQILSGKDKFDLSKLDKKDVAIMGTLLDYVAREYPDIEELAEASYNGMDEDLSWLLSEVSQEIPIGISYSDYVLEQIDQYPNLKNLVDKLKENNYSNLNITLLLLYLGRNLTKVNEILQPIQGIDINEIKTELVNSLDNYFEGNQINEDNLEDESIPDIPEDDINYYAIQEYTTQDIDQLLGTNLSSITSDNNTFDFSALTDKDKEVLNTLSWYILEKMEMLYNTYGRNEQALNHLYDGMSQDLSNIIFQFNDYTKDKEDLPVTKIEYLDEHITQYPEIEKLIDNLEKIGLNNLNTILYLNNLINNYNYMDTFGMEGIDTNKLKDDFTHLLQDYEASLTTQPVTNDDVQDNDLKKNDEQVIVTQPSNNPKPTVNYSDNLKWNYTGNKDLQISLETSPYDAVKMTGAPINARCNGRIRDKNARYGVKNSWHKVAWKGTNQGSATDLYPAPGYTYDDLLKALAHPALVKWANNHGYGILDERPASVRRKTHATGPHLHFGPNRVKLGDCPLIQKYKAYWKSILGEDCYDE